MKLKYFSEKIIIQWDNNTSIKFFFYCEWRKIAYANEKYSLSCMMSWFHHISKKRSNNVLKPLQINPTFNYQNIISLKIKSNEFFYKSRNHFVIFLSLLVKLRKNSRPFCTLNFSRLSLVAVVFPLSLYLVKTLKIIFLDHNLTEKTTVLL